MNAVGGKTPLARRQVLRGLAALVGALGAACKATPPGDAALGAAGSAGNTAGPAAAAIPPERQPSFSPQLFTREQALAVEDMAELIVPETDTPGARRAGVPEFVENTVRDVFDDSDRVLFLTGLDDLDRAARAAHRAPFHACSTPQQAALLEGLVTATRAILAVNDWPEPIPFFLAFYEAVIEGYCRSKLGATRTLQYDPVPGDYEACVPLERVGRAWALN